MLRLLALRSFVVVLLLLLASAAAQQGAASPPAPSRAAAQEPAHDPALEALLARIAASPADVGKAIAAVRSPAARARLQAAFGPLRLRPMAMLAVARAFPDDSEADLALLAAVAALLVHQGRGDAVPELARWSDELGDDRLYFASQQVALLPTVVALRREVDARRAAGGDAAVLDEAAALLAIASVSRGGGAAVQLRRDASFSSPADLGEPIELAFHPRVLPAYEGSPGDRHRLDWRELRTLGAPLQRTLLTPRRAVATAPVPPGHYLLAVRSQATPWWGVVPIEVSDLEALAVVEDEAVAVAAWADGHPVDAPFELAGGSQVLRGTLAGGPQVVALDDAVREGGYAYDLRLGSEVGPARLLGTIPGPERYAVDERWRVHSMLDRPLCRPGETIAGRIVLRRCTREGLGRARVPTTTVAAECAVRVRFRFGDAGEVVCAGRTDAHGTFAFEVVVPATAAPDSWVAADVEVPDVDAEGAPLRVVMPTTFAIAHFALAATTLATEGPAVRSEHDDCEIAAVVRYASGAPVAGQLVHADVDGHTTALRTDADGRAVLRLPIAPWDAWRAQQSSRGRLRSFERQVEFSLLGPDGQPQRRTHVVHDHEPAATAAAESRSWGARRDEPRIDLAPAVAGRPTRIVVHGPAGARALLVVGRSRHARAFALQFDERGHAAQSVDVLRTDWPRLDVALVDRDTLVRDDTFVTLAPVVPAVIELPNTAAPGSDVPCRVRTGRPGALVTLAVVDERLFAIEPERTCEPTASLRPSAPAADWQRMARAARAEPADLLAAMLVHGRVPPLDWQTFGQGVSAPGCGGPAAGMGGPPSLRADFRTVAHFGTVVADGDGLATFVVRLPSDLTTWRATAAVVDANGEGVLTTAATSTRMPWSVEPIVPRGIRAGDTFELPLVVAHDATIAGQPAAAAVGTAVATALEVVVRTEAEQLAAVRDVVPVTVPRGGARAVTVPMRAVASGEARLGLELRGPLALDRSQRQVAIERDAVVRSRVVAQRGSGTVRVPLPVAASAEDALVVEVLLGNAAVWSQLEQDLATYPYGCAEQTLAKLLPYFAVARARARASRGEALPALDEAGQRRLRAGLSRLRQLRAGAARFSFWPGGDGDREISVLVKHGLAVLREAGVDLAHERLDVAGAFLLPTPPADGPDEAAWAAFAMAIEEAAATLRLAPDAERARQLARLALPALDGVARDGTEAAAGQPVRFALAAGTAARLGLALLTAGAQDAARTCLARLDRGAVASEVAATYAGEDPMAVAAMQLELRLALDADTAAIDRAVAELELACVARRGSTYGQACAAAALALVVTRTDVRTADVVVEVAGERRTLHLGSDGGALGRLQFPRSGEVVVRGPDGALLLVRVTSVHTQRGSDHAAWRRPLTVERSLHALPIALDIADRERVLQAKLGDAMPHLAGPLPAGRPVLLVVRTTSPVSMRHVVVECPLPCGFELAAEMRGVERFPSHVAFVADLRAGEPFEQRLLLVPTVVGRFAWPPTTAAPMYAADHDGGTAGGWVEVVAPPPGNEPVRCVWQPPVLAEPDAGASSRAAELAARRARFDALRAWWDHATDGEPADAEQAARRTSALGFDPTTADPFTALAALDDWLDEAAFWAWPRVGPGGERRAVDLDEWLRAQLRLAFAAAMRCPIPRDAVDAAAQVQLCDGALQQLREEDDVVPRRMQLLARAAVGAPAMVACVLRGMPTAPEVAEQWNGYRELLHAALVHPEAEVRGEALARLSPAQRAELPVAVLLRAHTEPMEVDLVRQLAGNEAQAAAFELALHDPDLVAANERALRLALPPAWWLRLPLRVFERLADDAYPDACDDAWHVPMLGDLVARSRATDVELVHALGDTSDSRYRGVLAFALRARGVRAVGSAQHVDDVTFAAWAQAIALAADDAAGALALLPEHLAGNGAISAYEPSASLGRFLRRTIVEHGTPLQVHSIARALDDDSWARVWGRFAADERVLLVDRFLHELPDAFVPATMPEAEALWRCMLRNDSVDSTMDNLTATAAGVQCVRRHVDAGDGGELAPVVRAAFADALGLAAESLLPAPGDEGDAMLATLRRLGAEAEGSPGERAWLERLRRQLGASPPLR